MSELGLDVLTGPFRRLVCRIRGHRLVPGSHWQGSMACGRCGLGVRVSCSCRFDRPSARDLTGHRYDCPLHPPPGWPFGQPIGRALTGPQRVRAKLREQGLASTGGDSPDWRISEGDLTRWFEQEDAAQRRRAEQFNRWADQLPPESRTLVRDPNDRLWLLDEAGRVNRRVEPEEMESWASWSEPSDIRAAEGEPMVILPSRYVGIPYRISRVTWAEYVRLGGPPPGPPNPPRPPHDRPYA